MDTSIPELLISHLAEAKEPVAAKEIVTALAAKAEVTEGYTRNLLSRLSKEKRVVQPRRGYYTLPTGNSDHTNSNARRNPVQTLTDNAPAVVIQHADGSVWMEGFLTWRVVNPFVRIAGDMKLEATGEMVQPDTQN